MDQGHDDAPAVMRRRRKVARQQREKTPEPSAKNTVEAKRISDEESSSTADPNVQTVRMQLRPPGSISAHKSKILSRRNKTFVGSAARSLSAPRKVEKDENSNPEVTDLLRYARRSLSSPRHKEESSESGRSSPQSPKIIIPPPVPPRAQFPEGYQQQNSPSNEDRISRLERNLKRFEEERRKFDLEKKKLEREKRDLHRIRYKYLDAEERKRLFENYKKCSDWLRIPMEDSDENRRKVHSFREPSRKPLIDTLPKTDVEQFRRFSEYESSTVSESDSEAIQADVDDEEIIEQPVVPVQERRSLSHHSSSLSPKRKNTSEVSVQEQNEKTKNGEMLSQLQPESKKELEPIKERKGFLSRVFSIFKRKDKQLTTKEEIPKLKNLSKLEENICKKSFLKFMIYEFRQEWKQMKADYPQEVRKIRIEWNKCLSHIIVLGLFVGFGGLIFRFIEGTFENTYKCQVRKIKRDFIDQLWMSSHNMRFIF